MMNKTLEKISKIQGVAGRSVDHLPDNLKLLIAKAMGYRHDYPRLDPHLKILLAARKLMGKEVLLGKDARKSRLEFSRQMAAIQTTPTAVQSTRDFSISTPNGALTVRHYLPEQHQNVPLLVFFHGGGFIVGDVDTHDEPCRLLCHYGQMQVLSVNYRLAPEHPAPAAVEDCRFAFEWALKNASLLEADPTKVVVAGDSAGGNLAAVVSQMTKANIAPYAQLLIYPAVDLLHQYDSHQTFAKGLFLSDIDVKNATDAYVYSGGLTLEHALITPMLGDLNGLASAFVVTAGNDVLRDEGEAYANHLTDHGVQVRCIRIDEQGHGFINLTPINKAAKSATIKIAQDFRVFIDSLEAKLDVV